VPSGAGAAQAGPAGHFIALEGPDGAGKSLQAARLATALRAEGQRVLETREPGGTALGERIRQLLLESEETARSPESDALLFNAARGQLVREVIRPALARGDVVICDRFSDSTLAYQGWGAGLDVAVLRVLEVFATGGLRPTLVILLDLPVEIGLRRRAGGPADQMTRFERSPSYDRPFHERVRRGYHALAAEDPLRWRVIDAARPPDVVAADVQRAAMEILARSEPAASLARMDR
jgi:dTMP kinase